MPLAYVLDDEALKTKAQKWIEAILASQRADGQFGPVGEDDWWPRMVAAKVMTQHADATGDERVEPFLSRYFAHQLAEMPGRPLAGWGRARGAENVLSILWLHARTGEDWLLDLGRLVISQTADWATFLLRDLPPGPVPVFRHLTHSVNLAMGLKTPAVASLLDGDLLDGDQLDGDPGHADETEAMFAALDTLHGLVHGVFSGDEWLGGREPHHGVETCLVVELMFTLEQLSRIYGDGQYGDRLEEVAYNLLAASNDPRMLAHQYHQQANQVLVSFATRDWSFAGPDSNVFGLEPHFGCCTANLHQGWPKLVRSLWMQDADEALTAVAYGPCHVEATVGGTPVTLDVDTDYPFEETVRICVGVDAPVELTLRMRVPRWCADPGLIVAGSAHDVEPDEDGYVSVRRTWRTGDVVVLDLPMTLRTVPRDGGAVGFRLGPLVMVHGIKEIWRPVPDHAGLAEWEIGPRSFWNVGAWVDDPAGIESWRIERGPVPAAPFTAVGAPVVVHGRGAQIDAWRMERDSAGRPPTSPVATGLPVIGLTLLPYGSARIRVAELPTVRPLTYADEDA